MLYNFDFPDGRVFTDKTEYEKALREGWVEAPWLIAIPTFIPLAQEEPMTAKEEVQTNGNKPDGHATRKRRAPAAKRGGAKRNPNKR
jgi:hypothetical protein